MSENGNVEEADRRRDDRRQAPAPKLPADLERRRSDRRAPAKPGSGN